MWIFRESVESRGIGIGGGESGEEGILMVWDIEELCPGNLKLKAGGPVDIGWRRDIYFLGDE